MMIDMRKNSFTFIRYIAALQVMLLHIITHFDLKVNTNIIVRFPGVIIFFVLSGFLIAFSLDRNNKNLNFMNYCKKRFERIYPELWMSLLVLAITLLISKPSIIKDISFYIYMIAQGTVLQFFTPDSLRFYGVGVPNGSLWTITVFVQFYFIIYFLYPKIKQLKFKNHCLLFVISVFMNTGVEMFQAYYPNIVYKLLSVSILPYWYIFYIGIIIYLFKDKIIQLLIQYYWIVWIVFILINCVSIDIPFVYCNPIHAFVLSLLSIATAYKFYNIKIKNDLTFGIYLFHMIFVNVFVHYGFFGMNKYVCMVLVVVFSVMASLCTNFMNNYLRRKRYNHEKIKINDNYWNKT